MNITIKHIISRVISAICIMTFFSSCSNDNEITQSVGDKLKITAQIDGVDTRAYVTVRDKEFQANDRIGIFVQNTSKGIYNNNKDAVNNLCVFDGTYWESKPWIELTETKGTVYAYFPYREGVNSTTFTYDLSDEIDLLYGSMTPSTTVDKNNNTARLTFKHALSWITFNVKKTSTSTKNAVLTDFTMGNYIEDSNNTIISNKATFDVTTGKLSAISDPTAMLVSTNNVSLSSTEYTSINMLVIPVIMGGSGRANVMLYINGQAYEAALKNEKWEAGKHYTYDIIANVGDSNFDTEENSIALYISTPTIESWTTGSPTTSLGILEGDIESVPGEAVDLGLPSGTLWSDRNIGATTPTGGGLYYSYGEVVSKPSYSINDYIYYGSGTYKNIGKYDSSTDYYEIAGTEYDVAHRLWQGNWHIPTLKEWEELVDNTEHSLITIDGTNCYKFIGNNGNHIIMPCTGLISSLNNSGEAKLCFYNRGDSHWGFCYRLSTSKKTPNNYVFLASIDKIYLGYDFLKEAGCSIRPVTK